MSDVIIIIIAFVFIIIPGLYLLVAPVFIFASKEVREEWKEIWRSLPSNLAASWKSFWSFLP